jgi:hypothetical protein
MTKLAATRNSAAALEYASALILRAHRKDESGSFFETPSSREFCRRVLQLMLLTATGRLDLLALARAGDGDAQAVLGDAIVELTSRRAPLPAEFDGYLMELAVGKVPRAPRGRDKRDNFLHDVCIAATVAATCDRYGLRPTGRSARRRSGCAVVAQALGVISMQIGVKAVERAWTKYRSAMPPKRDWTFALENKALPS